MVLMPGMVITPEHLYGGGCREAQADTRFTHRAQNSWRRVGSASSSLDFLPENKSFGQEFESVQLKVWFVDVWKCC